MRITYPTRGKGALGHLSSAPAGASKREAPASNLTEKTVTRPEFSFVITLRKCILFLKIIISLSVILFHFLKEIEEQLKKRGITKDKDVSEIYLANRLSLFCLNDHDQ